MLLSSGKTLLLYIAILMAFYVSDRLNSSSGDAALKQTFLVLGAAALVILGALLYAIYQAFSQSPKWWAVVGLHIVLGGALFVWASR